jgi:hypothetical protein
MKGTRAFTLIFQTEVDANGWCGLRSSQCPGLPPKVMQRLFRPTLATCFKLPMSLVEVPYTLLCASYFTQNYYLSILFWQLRSRKG